MEYCYCDTITSWTYVKCLDTNEVFFVINDYIIITDSVNVRLLLVFTRAVGTIFLIEKGFSFNVESLSACLNIVFCSFFQSYRLRHSLRFPTHGSPATVDH